MSDAPSDESRRRGIFIVGAALVQALVAPYLLLAGLMAAEMSAMLAFAAGVVVAFMSPPWLGGIHAAGAATLLGALWAGRPAVTDEQVPSSA